MNRISTLFAAAIVVLNSFSQTAPVPTSWDCSGVLPVGWSQDYTGGTSANQFYTGSGLFISTPSSARLDGTNEFVAVALSDVPGYFSYNLRGSTTSSSAFQGTVKSQQSVNGTNWTDMRTLTNAQIDKGAFTLFVDTPNAASRHLRILFSNKVSGFNLAVEDVAVAIPVAGPNQEIELTYNNAKITTGEALWFNAPVDDSVTITFKVFNLGSDSTLQLSNPTLSLNGAFYYSIASFPDSVLANDSAEIAIKFKPVAEGTEAAKLTFNNNDADENPYEIFLNGVGGNFATEPAAPTGSITISNIKAYSMTATVSGNNADGYIVLRKEEGTVTDAPVDGQTYDVGMGIGTSKVFYVGSNSSFPIGEVKAGLEYHFAVFPYNGVGQYTNYRQTSPLDITRTSGAALPGNYYNGIDTASPNFPTALSTLINNHNQIFYSNYKSTIIDNFYTRDTTGDQKVVNCEYSGQFVLFTPPFDFTPLNMSREHALASSWMPTFGTTGHEDREAYSDQHNLRLANQNDVNAPRSNDPFDDIVTPTGNFLLAKFGRDADNKKVFEPRDDIKGDVARSIMYMIVAYNRQPNTGFGQPSIAPWSLDSLVIPGTFPSPDEKLSTRQKQALLKKWNQQDPPSPFERARNEFVFDQQANRNPFTDHPDWACYIDFNTMTYIANGCNAQVGINEIENGVDVATYPNPATEKLTVSIISEKTYAAVMELTDMSGKTVLRKSSTINAGENWFEIGLNDFVSGNYILTVSGNGLVKKKVQIIR